MMLISEVSQCCTSGTRGQSDDTILRYHHKLWFYEGRIFSSDYINKLICRNY
jgi:hypothetical protein